MAMHRLFRSLCKHTFIDLSIDICLSGGVATLPIARSHSGSACTPTEFYGLQATHVMELSVIRHHQSYFNHLSEVQHVLVVPSAAGMCTELPIGIKLKSGSYLNTLTLHKQVYSACTCIRHPTQASSQRTCIFMHCALCV